MSMASITSDAASSSSSYSSTHPWKFDVFLSFRGEDTRKSFTDHLYSALDRKGIYTFRDEERLERGKSIAPELLKTIEESRFAIVVFSKNYASSTWCLVEVSKIAECKKGTGQTVFPIFYDVEPSEVRKQTGAFKEAFAKHEEIFKDNLEKVKKWREALLEIANVSGWDLLHRHESEVVNEVVETILNQLKRPSSSVDGDLVGMNCRMEKMLSYLEIGRSDDVRIVGICGMGGIGKTTLAQEVFRKIRDDRFDASCFLANVREETDKYGLIVLQKRLHRFLVESEAMIQNIEMGINILRDRLRYRKVLIILDDVDKLDQIEALAGRGDLGAPGSRIIVTTRDQKLLQEFGENNICEVDMLTTEEALQLFCKKAFKNNHPPDEYKDKSREVLKYANGLPLALKVLGSFLYKRTQKQWSSTLTSLKEDPKKGIMGPLRVSYNGLEEPEQRMFLDIACFFKGEVKCHVEKILEKCDGFYQVDITVLEEKSLITIIGEKLWMHDLLQELARQIVRGEPPQEPGNRSRLSLHKDVLQVLKENSGTKSVEGILLITPQKEEVHLNVDPFPKMCRLRLLKILNVKISGCLGYLSNELRLLEWHKCPLTSMPSLFQPNKLVELNLSNSCIKQLWKGSKDLQNLIVINLSNCRLLTKTPDFSKIRNLEKLILKGCKTLSEVDESIQDLEKLVLLDLEGCECLEKLSTEISLKSLETMNLSGCLKLNKFPEIREHMAKLSELYLEGTAITELPMSIKHLTGLTLLNLKDCKNLQSLPDCICSFTSLKTLMLSGCSSLDQLPNDLGNLECLQELDASETAISKVPSSIQRLKNLKRLSLRGCKGHTPLPHRSIWQSLFCCCLLPSEGSESMSLTLELPLSFAGLFSLRSLDLSRCNLPERGIPNDIGHLSLLEKLDLSENNFRKVPESISQLSNLRELHLNGCKKLESLPSLPSSVKQVNACGCASLRHSNDLTIWTSKKGLCIIDCQKSRVDKGLMLHKIPIAQEHIHLQLQNFAEDEIRQRKQFGYEFPQSGIPDWCSENSSNGSSITIELPPELDSIEWMGFALCIVYKSQKEENSDPPTLADSFVQDAAELTCHFETPEGSLEKSLDFQVIIDRSRGSLGHCKYIPREWFDGKLKKASQLEISFSTKSQEVEVTMCGVHILYEKNVGKFVQNLFQPSEQALAWSSHYQEIVEHVTKSTTIDEMSSIIRETAIIDERSSIIRERKIINEMESVEQQPECALTEPSYEKEEDNSSLNPFLIHIEAKTGRHMSCSTNQKDELRRGINTLLSRLFKGHYVHDFNFACIFPLKAILRWFTYQCVGRLVLCCLPPNLFDDETWVGFAVYVVFTWNPSISLDDLDPVFPPFLFAHLHASGSKVRHTALFSLGKDGLTGPKHRLVVFYVPRMHFQQELNQCWQISVLFSTTIPKHVEIEICGIRIVYEKNLKEFVQTITECSLESPDVHHQRYNQTFEKMEKKIFHRSGTTSEHNAMEGEIPIKAVDLGYFYSSSQREYESLHEQAPEDPKGPTSQQGIPSASTFSGSQTNTPTENGQDIAGHLLRKYYQGIDPGLIYGYCFPPSDIPKGFNHHNDYYSVKIQLPINSYSERNWIGLALWASFSIKELPKADSIEDQDFDIPHHLSCHLETDTGSLVPLHSHQTTNEESKWLHLTKGLVWLSYIPRAWFSNKLNQCSILEASFGSESRGLYARKCGLCFVYGKGAEEFQLMIEHCTKVFWEDWDLIQEILVEKDSASLGTSSDQKITQGSSSHLAPTFVLLDIMAETPLFDSHHSISEWTRNLENLLKKFFKVSLIITLSLTGHIISMLRGFEPNFNYNFCFPRKEIPQWFQFQISQPEMMVELHPSLLNDSWLGFAICVAFAVHENPAAIFDNDGEEIHVNLLCHFNMNEHCVNSMFSIPKEEFKWKHTGGFIWLTYRSRWLFPDFINQQSHLKITIHSDPGLKVQKCGIRLLYNQNLEEFEQMIIQCLTSFYDDLDPIFKYLGDRYRRKGHANKWETPGSADSNVKPQQYKRSEEPACHEDFALDSKYGSSENSHNAEVRVPSASCHQNLHIYSGKYDPLDFDRDILYNSCFPPTEILEWFRNHRGGPSAEIQLTPDLFGEDNWLGLALCAYFSYPNPEYPTTFSENLDTQISHHLICLLQTERESLEHLHVHQTNNEEFRWLNDRGRFIWVSYIPREWFSDQLKDCSSMEASFVSDSRSLLVQKCGLRLVYVHDVDELKKTISHCKSSLFEYQYHDHAHVGDENSNKQCQDGGRLGSGSTISSSSTEVDPHQERSERPNDTNIKDKGKRVVE